MLAIKHDKGGSSSRTYKHRFFEYNECVNAFANVCLHGTIFPWLTTPNATSTIDSHHCWGRNLHSRRQWSKLKAGIAMCKLNLMNSAVIIWTQSSQVLFSENRCTWKSSRESLDCEWLLLRQLRLRMTYFTIKLLQWNTINFPFTIPKFTTGCASGKVSETDNKSF